MTTVTFPVQRSMFAALDDLRFAQAQAAREPQAKHTGRRRDDGTPIRGFKLAFCAHWDCAGQRKVWRFKGVSVCEHHWRQRRRLAALKMAQDERRMRLL